MNYGSTATIEQTTFTESHIVNIGDVDAVPLKKFQVPFDLPRDSVPTQPGTQLFITCARDGSPHSIDQSLLPPDLASKEIKGVVYRFGAPCKVSVLDRSDVKLFEAPLSVLQAGWVAIIPVTSNPFSKLTTVAAFDEGGNVTKFGRSSSGIFASTQPSGGGK